MSHAPHDHMSSEGGSAGQGPDRPALPEGQPQPAAEASLTAAPRPSDEAPTPLDHVVSLVSGLVINQRAFVNNCGIPFGAVVDFRPAESLGLCTVHGRLPPRCRGCSSFLHVYCKTNPKKNLWKCTFCEVVNSAPDVDFTNLQAHPELLDEGVDFAYDPPSPPAAPPPLHLVLVIDATQDAPALEGLSSALLSAMESQPPDTVISVVSFDAVVALHALGPDRRFSVALPGAQTCSADLVQSYLRSPDVPLSAPLSKCLAYLPDVLAGVRALQTSTPQRSRARCSGVAVEASLVLLTGVLSQALGGLPGGSPPGGAVSVGRLLLFVGGPITRGPGFVPLEMLDGIERDKASVKAVEAGVQYASDLGQAAAAVGIAIDIFIGVSGVVNAPLLLTLARCSGGEAAVQEGFGPLFHSCGLPAALGRRLGDHATLDCYASGGVRLVQWMGPVDTLKLPSDPRVLCDRRLSGSACSVAAFDLGRGVGLRLELTRDLAESPVYLQVVLRYNELRTGRLITRVVTRRIFVVGSLADFLQSVNPLAAAVVIGKKAALDAQKSQVARDPRRAEEMRYTVGALLNLMATRCGKQVQASRGVLGFGGRKLWLCPRELQMLAQALYHLQRGPLIGAQSIAHADDKSLLIERILCAAGGVTFRTLSPQLYVYDEGGGGGAASNRPPGYPPSSRPTWSVSGKSAELLIMPAANVAVSPDRTYVLDCGTSYSIVAPPPAAPAGGPSTPPPVAGPSSAASSPAATRTQPHAAAAHLNGSANSASSEPTSTSSNNTAGSDGRAAGDQRALLPPALLGAVSRAALGRFPGPDLHCSAHDSPEAAALFYSRVTPIHKDSPQEQRSQVPSLQPLDDAALTKLAHRFWSAPQDISFVQWCHGVGVQPYSTA